MEALCHPKHQKDKVRPTMNTRPLAFSLSCCARRARILAKIVHLLRSLLEEHSDVNTYEIV